MQLWGDVSFFLFILTVLYLCWSFIVIFPVVFSLGALLRLKKAVHGRMRWFPVPWRLETRDEGKTFYLWFSSELPWTGFETDVHLHYGLRGHFPFKAEITRKEMYGLLKIPNMSQEERIQMKNDAEKAYHFWRDYVEKSEIGQIPIDKKYAIKSQDSPHLRTLLEHHEIQKILDELFFARMFLKVRITPTCIYLFKTSSCSHTGELNVSLVRETFEKLSAFSEKINHHASSIS